MSVIIKSGASGNTANVDGSGNLQVVVNGGTPPTGAATSANQTNGAQLSQVVDPEGNVFKTPLVFKTAQATALGNTPVWTPASGKKFRLLKLFVQLTENASIASAGVVTISFQDSASALPIAFDVFVPGTAVTTTVGDGISQTLDLGAVGILSAVANNVLNVNLSVLLATGNVRVIAMGTEE